MRLRQASVVPLGILVLGQLGWSPTSWGWTFWRTVGPQRPRGTGVLRGPADAGVGRAVPDHFADIFAPIPALVRVAEATKTLRVGTNVLSNDFRSREAATVDLLTDGRLQLGLGAGYMKSEYKPNGTRFRCGQNESRAAG